MQSRCPARSVFLGLILIVALVTGTASGALKELKEKDIEALRIVSQANLPHKILVASQIQANLKFLTSLIMTVAKIHEEDRLGPEDSFKVSIIPSMGEKITGQTPLRKAVPKKIFEKYVEYIPQETWSDPWLQDIGEVAMVKVKNDPKPQLLIIDSQRGQGLAALPEFLAKLWNSYYLKNPTDRQPGGDSGGNIEATPDDILIIGSRSSKELRDLFARHGYQNRMAVVDTDWLVVGHCDEYLSAVPTDRHPDGYGLVKANPRLALRLLADASRQELENVRPAEFRNRCLAIFNFLEEARQRANARQGETSDPLTFGEQLLIYLENVDPQTGMVSEQARIRYGSVWNRAFQKNLGEREVDGESVERFIRANLALANLIDTNVELVRDTVNRVHARPSKTPIGVHSFPMLFEPYHQAPQYGKIRFVSSFPGVVNQLILRRHLLVPDPLITAFRQQIRTTAKALGMKSHFIDDMYYHQLLGDVHCATNVFRLPNRYIIKPANLPAIWQPRQ
ncbi:MAG TPA: protein-arginine deiminase family protein [Candidatus Ozemobacteraceae bacterium]|nr:protein-arginine deiminase family protein [Candidatus Ozemobacteraceae bacterium]